jgi:hypothetical protein
MPRLNDIEERQVKGVRLDRSQGRLTVCCGDHIVPQPAKPLRQAHDDVRVVVSDQNANAHRAPLSGGGLSKKCAMASAADVTRIAGRIPGESLRS